MKETELEKFCKEKELEEIKEKKKSVMLLVLILVSIAFLLTEGIIFGRYLL